MGEDGGADNDCRQQPVALGTMADNRQRRKCKAGSSRSDTNFKCLSMKICTLKKIVNLSLLRDVCVCVCERERERVLGGENGKRI